ncbi:TPA: NPCBM/NEW2 domain-containing protein, partial [Clostridium perfringens]
TSASVIFKIYVDGEEKFNSGIVNGTTDQQYVKVDVKDAKELKLIVTDADNGNKQDHANWADAKLVTLSSKPEILGEDLAYPIGTKINLMEGITANDIEDGDLTSQVEIKSSDFVEGKSGVFTIVYTVTDSDGLTSEFSRFIALTEEEVQLSSLNWESATIGSGSVRKNRAVSNNAIRLLDENKNVETFDTGIGTHSYSEIVYNSEGYDIFDTWVGVDQYVSTKSESSVVFKVYVDGELKAQTDVMKSDTPKERLVVDIRNSNEVKLVVDVADNGNTWDHADWANARFLKIADYDTTELKAVLAKAKDIDLTLYTEETAN